LTESAVSLSGIRKRYGDRTALDGLHLEVERGSFHALLGPNGAGKTTTMRILLGFIRPDDGQGSVLGVRLGGGFPTVDLKSRIGYVPERSSLYETMTAREILDFARGLNPRWDTKTEKRYADLFRLPMDVNVRHMSTGVRAQLALTLAMSARPELLVLDEPTRGLDAAQRFRYLQALVEDCMEDGRTVLLSSHDLYQMERIADHVTILKAGKAVVNGPLDQVKESEKRVRVSGDVSESALMDLPGARKVTGDTGCLLVHVSGDIEVFKAAAGRIAGIAGIQVLDQSLEEIFLSYVE
jgi:ABC-2 type transport system ATP-binding protein